MQEASDRAVEHRTVACQANEHKASVASGRRQATASTQAIS